MVDLHFQTTDSYNIIGMSCFARMSVNGANSCAVEKTRESIVSEILVYVKPSVK